MAYHRVLFLVLFRLFYIFINDSLFIGSISSVDLYADNTTLHAISLDKVAIENNLQHALNLLKT